MSKGINDLLDGILDKYKIDEENLSHKETLRVHVLKLLLERGVTLESMAKIVYDLQYPYKNHLTVDYCEEVIFNILLKTEVQNAIMLGIEIDKLHEKGLISDKYLSDMISEDAGCFGLDEAIGVNPTGCYGTIAFTNFGYLDKAKVGIIKELDNSTEQTNVFLDDLVCGICACACGKIAHSN